MELGIQVIGALFAPGTEKHGFFRAIRRMGYTAAEICVSMVPFPGAEHAIWPIENCADGMAAIGEAGLKCSSCHVFTDDPEADAEKLARFSERYGVRNFVLKSPKELTEQSVTQAAEKYVSAAELLTDAGAELWLHNEARDIAAKLGGRTAYEYLLDLCAGRLFAQADVGWVLAGGEDPAALLTRNAGRVKSVHYKDHDGTKETPIGQGRVDLPFCARFARDRGCAGIVDMDSYPNGFEKDAVSAFNVLTAVR